MRVGVLRETKDREMRVALLPAGARALVAAGNEVVLEAGAGEGSGFPDEQYEAVGASIAKSPQEVIEGAEIVTKVKEPTPSEIAAMRPGQTLFDFLHLAPEPALTRSILERGIVAIGYETVQLEDGSLPLLMPMSGGRRADRGAGRRVLPAGRPGRARRAARRRTRRAAGRRRHHRRGHRGHQRRQDGGGARRRGDVLDTNLDRLRTSYDIFRGELSTLASNHREPAEQAVRRADIVIGAVLIPGALGAQAGHARDGRGDEGPAR